MRQIGDLGAYITAVDANGAITLDLAPRIIFSCMDHGVRNMKCSGGPPKTTRGIKIDKDALGRVERALELLNQSLATGNRLTINIQEH